MSREITKKMQTGTLQKGKTYDMAYIAVFAVLITICSWISIPTTIPFTMQTFAIFFSVLVLGGRRGTLAIVIYILLGAVGIPVFAEFTGGIGIIMGPTGGYFTGFILSALIMWTMEHILGRKVWVQILSMILGMLAYYTAGTIWFMIVYMKNTGNIGLTTALGWCVIPFIIPDLLKAALALGFDKALKKPLSSIIN